MTVTRSVICLSSSSRWEMWTMPVAPLAEVAGDPEQLVDLGVGEGGGRLVHDQDVRVVGQRLAISTICCWATASRDDAGARIQPDVEILEQLARSCG